MIMHIQSDMNQNNCCYKQLHIRYIPAYNSQHTLYNYHNNFLHKSHSIDLHKNLHSRIYTIVEQHP